MCYTAIWSDLSTSELYYSQEVASADRTRAWGEIAKRSSTCEMIALIAGYHGVTFSKEQGLTTPPNYAILKHG